MHIKISQLPEGSVIEFTTVTNSVWQYTKEDEGWVSGTYYMSDNDFAGLEAVGVEIRLISFPKPVEVDESTSDGYHTFKELYEMRLLLTAHLFNEWGENLGDNNPLVFKSLLHSDGTIPFDDPNWFIVVAETRVGQISFHYEMEDWDLFYNVPEVTLPPKYDGHTAADVAIRLRELLKK